MTLDVMRFMIRNFPSCDTMTLECTPWESVLEALAMTGKKCRASWSTSVGEPWAEVPAAGAEGAAGEGEVEVKGVVVVVVVELEKVVLVSVMHNNEAVLSRWEMSVDMGSVGGLELV